MTTNERCDFCDQPEPRWLYKTKANVLMMMSGQGLVTIHDEPGWAACDMCAGMIDREEIEELKQRVERSYLDSHREPPPNVDIKKMVEVIVSMFLGSKISGREPISG